LSILVHDDSIEMTCRFSIRLLSTWSMHFKLARSCTWSWSTCVAVNSSCSSRGKASSWKTRPGI